MSELIKNELWKVLFNPEDTAWLETLKKVKTLSIKSVLEDMARELRGSKILMMHIQEYGDYAQEGQGYVLESTMDYFSPVLSDRSDMLEIIAEDGSDYCRIDLECIENLIFERVYSDNDKAAYVIYGNEGGLLTKIEFIIARKVEYLKDLLCTEQIAIGKQ